ncbi:MAG: SIMPL domain-containing protein [Chloroflexota bacterium]
MSSKFQNVMLIGIAIVVIALFLRRPEKQIPIVQDIQVTQPEERTITVSSEGEVITNLDKVEFVLIFESEEKELADAKLKTEEYFTDAVNILNTHGVEEKDMMIGPLQVRVKTGYFTVEEKVVGYIVYRTMRVTLRHMDEFMPLLTDIQEETHYKVEDIVFSVSNIDGYRERVLQMAIQNATAKAKAIGREINSEIGEVISIQAVDSISSPSYSFGTLDAFFREGTNRWEKPLWIYEVTIRVNVLVKFELK